MKNYKTIVLPEKYVPKKTEKYMCAEHKAYFYQMLMAERAEREAEIESPEDVVLGQQMDSIGAMDEGDAATLSIEADLNIKIQEKNLGVLKQIDAALARLEDDTYGYSVISGDEIGLKRLMARPVAATTSEEKSTVEK